MIKYPNQRKTSNYLSVEDKNILKKESKKNLGMSLEKDIEDANKYYRDNKIALIYKKPTPVKIVKVNYPSRSAAKIVEAYYTTPSTTDFNGIFNKQYIDFDAKETSSKTSFPLSNIHEHQYQHLKRVHEEGGIGFLIIKWNYHNETYILHFEELRKFWENKEFERKSIPYDYFKNNKTKIFSKGFLLLNYLERLKEELKKFEKVKSNTID